MISTLSQYSSIPSESIIYDLKNLPIETKKDWLIQFNDIQNVFLNNSNFDFNISIPKCNLYIKPEQINNQYKYIDSICVFNLYDKKLFDKYEKQTKILNIPIPNNHSKDILPATQNHLINFGYIGNLSNDKPIIIDIINTFSKAAIINKKISLCLFIESRPQDITSFRDAVYHEINLDSSVETRIVFVSQESFTQEDKETFINSINILFCFNCFFADNYSMLYALNQQKILYTSLMFFKECRKVESFSKTILYNGQLINYASPNIDEIMNIFLGCHAIEYGPKQDSYINTGIGSIIND